MKISCGILPYRIKNHELEVFLVHPGGPFFAKKDKGFWGICKGELNSNEDELECAIREFKEEMGIDLSLRKNELTSLGEVIQKNSKVVKTWVIKEDLKNLVDENGFVDLTNISIKATITLNGQSFELPEIDKGEFFTIEVALEMINEKQKEFILKLKQLTKCK